MGKARISPPLPLTALRFSKKCKKKKKKKKKKLKWCHHSGVYAVIDKLTSQGFDMQFGTNVLGMYETSQRKSILRDHF